ncbi:hypothetical protein DC915_RS02100 [Vibrio parahaemolyticus]|nr:hypothetical protein [Vibrio parahaemolyticus]EJG0009767.1 hypothetical protein [Vibrio parahaemolyticus]ELA8176602.1 hypothetical protein [Vibrio alginolyticus]
MSISCENTAKALQKHLNNIPNHQASEITLDCMEPYLAKVNDDRLQYLVKDTKLLFRLERNLKKKIWDPVCWELREHGFGNLALVGRQSVYGRKRDASEYFKRSTAMRHLYQDTSVDEKSNSYSGRVYLYLGGGRYLKVDVWGDLN